MIFPTFADSAISDPCVFDRWRMMPEDLTRSFGAGTIWIVNKQMGE